MSRALFNIVDSIYQRLALLCFSTLALIVGWQVFARYVLNASPSWSEPLSMLLMLYAVLLGAAVGVRNNLHLRLSWFLSKFNKQTQARLLVLQHLIVASLGVSMMFYGFKMAVQTWQYIIPGLSIAMGTQYLALVFSGFGLSLFSAEAIINREPD